MAKPRARAHEEPKAAPAGSVMILGEGDPAAKLIFLMSELSSNPASELLHKMIEAMGLKKDSVFIASLADNDSKSAISLETLKPQMIVALGESISQNLLATSSPISELRGIFRPFQGVKMIATFHPEDLIQKPDLKKAVWADLQNVAKELGITIPSRK